MVIQVYFKYEQSVHYFGIGQEVYEVKGQNSVFFRSIDSSIFQPDLLENSSSKPSYMIYSITLFCIICGCLFFVILDVGISLTNRSFGSVKSEEPQRQEASRAVGPKYEGRFSLFSIKRL